MPMDSNKNAWNQQFLHSYGNLPCALDAAEIEIGLKKLYEMAVDVTLVP